MSDSPTYNVKFRRRREGRTDYKKRLALLKSRKARLVVRKGHNSIVAELVRYDPKGDRAMAFVTSVSLKKFGWNGHTGNVPAAYLTGFACAKKGLKIGIKEAVFDIGLTSPIHGSAVYSALKGAIDAGMKIPADPKIFPSDERASGKHISEDTAKNFAEVKANISKEFG